MSEEYKVIKSMQVKDATGNQAEGHIIDNEKVGEAAWSSEKILQELAHQRRLSKVTSVIKIQPVIGSKITISPEFYQTIVVTNNLYKYDSTSFSNYEAVNYKTGEVEDDDPDDMNHAATGYIPVFGWRGATLKTNFVCTDKYGIAFYDSSERFIEGTNIADSVTVPQEAHYMKGTVSIDSLDIIIVLQGEELPIDNPIQKEIDVIYEDTTFVAEEESYYVYPDFNDYYNKTDAFDISWTESPIVYFESLTNTIISLGANVDI